MWKKHRVKITAAIVIAAVLTAAFYFGGNTPGSRGWSVSKEPAASAGVEEGRPGTSEASAKPEEPVTPEGTAAPGEPAASEETAVPEGTPAAKESAVTEEPEETAAPPETPDKPVMEIDPETGKDQYQTDPVPEGKPAPVEPQDVTASDVAHTCTLSVRCDTILDNIEWLDPEKVELVPEDGVIFPATEVTFYEGESVFDLLQREMREAGIHMEFQNTPIYNSAYIEGINNLYEFDCGELSGWMYKVNGWFPNYGCSRYQLQEGDTVEWVYTCDLGADVGDNSMS